MFSFVQRTRESAKRSHGGRKWRYHRPSRELRAPAATCRKFPLHHPRGGGVLACTNNGRQPMTLRIAALVLIAITSMVPASAQTRPADPRVAALADGDSAARLRALGEIRDARDLPMDDAVCAAMNKAAADTDPRVTRDLANLVGGLYIWNAKPQDPRAIEL